MPTQLINRSVKLEICVPDREENYKHLSVLVTQTFWETKIFFHCFNRYLLSTYYGAEKCTLEIQQRMRRTRALPL